MASAGKQPDIMATEAHPAPIAILLVLMGLFFLAGKLIYGFLWTLVFERWHPQGPHRDRDPAHSDLGHLDGLSRIKPVQALPSAIRLLQERAPLHPCTMGSASRRYFG
jgi:hypothetical protein